MQFHKRGYFDLSQIFQIVCKLQFNLWSSKGTYCAISLRASLTILPKGLKSNFPLNFRITKSDSFMRVLLPNSFNPSIFYYYGAVEVRVRYFKKSHPRCPHISINLQPAISNRGILLLGSTIEFEEISFIFA